MTRLTVLTWNIFFDSHKISERTLQIIKIVNDNNPDIICFQEVRKTILDVLIIEFEIGGYIIPNKDLQTGRVVKNVYSTLIFVKKSLSIDSIVNIIPFSTSYMERDILELNIENYCIINVHLESTNSEQMKKIRTLQLNEIIEKYKNSKTVVCGDFNIREKIQNDYFFDLDVCGDTYFSERFSDSKYSATYDKVIYNIKNCEYLKRLGDIEYSDGNYCSDHDGILFRIY